MLLFCGDDAMLVNKVPESLIVGVVKLLLLPSDDVDDEESSSPSLVACCTFGATGVAIAVTAVEPKSSWQATRRRSKA